MRKRLTRLHAHFDVMIDCVEDASANLIKDIEANC